MFEDWSLLREMAPVFASRIGMAVLCGFILGMEREWKDKPAGLRTILLITVGSTLYMMVSELIPLVAEGSEATLRIDPARIAAQVVSGVGFLGAGTILQARGAVHGLTTAAVIWVAAGLGLCIGIGFPLMALGLTLAVVLVLVAMQPVRDWFARRGPAETLTFLAPNDSLRLEQVRQVLEQAGVERGGVVMRPVSGDEVEVQARHHASGGAAARLVQVLARIDGVRGWPAFEE